MNKKFLLLCTVALISLAPACMKKKNGARAPKAVKAKSSHMAKKGMSHAKSAEISKVKNAAAKAAVRKSGY